MSIIGKPLLVLGLLAGVPAVGIGGYLGISNLDSRSSKSLEDSENKEQVVEGDNSGSNVQPQQPAATSESGGSSSPSPKATDGGTGASTSSNPSGTQSK